MEGSTALIEKVLLKRPSIFRDIGCLAGLACLVLEEGWATKEILLSDGEGANFFAIWLDLLSLLCSTLPISSFACYKVVYLLQVYMLFES